MAEDPDHNRSERPRPVSPRRYELNANALIDASMPFGAGAPRRSTVVRCRRSALAHNGALRDASSHHRAFWVTRFGCCRVVGGQLIEDCRA
jgi:hypothetical protein